MCIWVYESDSRKLDSHESLHMEQVHHRGLNTTNIRACKSEGST